MSDGYEEPPVKGCEGCVIRWGAAFAFLSFLAGIVAFVLVILRGK